MDAAPEVARLKDKDKKLRKRLKEFDIDWDPKILAGWDLGNASAEHLPQSSVLNRFSEWSVALGFTLWGVSRCRRR